MVGRKVSHVTVQIGESNELVQHFLMTRGDFIRWVGGSGQPWRNIAYLLRGSVIRVVEFSKSETQSEDK